jgi:hypothetical protein
MEQDVPEIDASQISCDAEIIVLDESGKHDSPKQSKPKADAVSKADRDKRLREELRALESLRKCCMDNNPYGTNEGSSSDSNTSSRSASPSPLSGGPHSLPSPKTPTPAHRSTSLQYDASNSPASWSPMSRTLSAKNHLQAPPSKDNNKRPEPKDDAAAASGSVSGKYGWIKPAPMAKLLTALKTSICESLLDPTIACRPCPDRNPLTESDYSMCKRVSRSAWNAMLTTHSRVCTTI